MGICSSEPTQPDINPLKVDNTHFEYLKVVGKGAFGKVNAVNRINGDKELLAIKRVSKYQVLKTDPTLFTVRTERDVMTKVKSKFCLNLINVFQDKNELSFVMPFMKGGDLRYYLSTHGKMNEETARFYAAEILLGIEDIHSINYVYRDLKPENCLFQEDGHICLSDYGIAFEVTEKDPFAISKTGTPGYLAPEILKRQPYAYAVDIYSYGVLIYELLHGYRPHEAITYLDTISPAAKDFLSGLLQQDPAHRLGCSSALLRSNTIKSGSNEVKVAPAPHDFSQIKNHKFFQGVNWDLMAEKDSLPPFVPDPDVANCSNSFSLEDQLSAEEFPQLSANDQAKFASFDFNIDFSSPDYLPELSRRVSQITTTKRSSRLSISTNFEK